MSDKEDILRVEISPQVRARMADDPELAEAMREMFASIKNAMQGVKDGRYKSFADAMEAITGHRPERIVLGEDEESLP